MSKHANDRILGEGATLAFDYEHDDCHLVEPDLAEPDSISALT